MTEVVSFDGTRLMLTGWGPTGAPLVILVHGLGLSTGSWGKVPRLLTERGYHVFAYDLRGHGQSGDAPGGDYSMKAQAKDLDAVLREVVPEDSAAVVVGNSLGGGIIVARAHHCGTTRIAGAVFVGSGGSAITFAGFPARNLPSPVRRALRWAWMTALRAAAQTAKLIRPLGSLSDRLARRFVFTPEDPDEAVVQARKDFLSSQPVVLARTALASVSHDGTRLAPDLSVPTLVLHGSGDHEVPEKDLSKLIKALPDPELVRLPGEGHMLPLTRPETVSEEISRWVRRTGGKNQYQ